jgi:N-ethylmaleimide reductase
MALEHLFSKAKLGPFTLPHRIVMAPLTRSRAMQPGDIPTELNATYYKQRAGAALIIAEATHISPQGKGYAYTPGIYSPAQVEGWKQVTQAVHSVSGHMFLQLWHVGRVSHSSLQPDGALPVSPSALPVTEGQAFTDEGFKDFETPRALETNEIPGIVDDYRQAAANAKDAGFDGVEIHAANGYLLEQFLKDGTNQRTDQYGGSFENRVRIVKEVIEAVLKVWDSSQVGIRISPTGTFNSMTESDPQALYEYLVEELNEYHLAYLHVVERFGDGPTDEFDFKSLRDNFNGLYIANGSYTAEKAEEQLADGLADLVAFGVPFIANPDLPERFKQSAPLNTPDPDTFYGGAEKGYTDYPALA